MTKARRSNLSRSLLHVIADARDLARGLEGVGGDESIYRLLGEVERRAVIECEAAKVACLALIAEERGGACAKMPTAAPGSALSTGGEDSFPVAAPGRNLSPTEVGDLAAKESKAPRRRLACGHGPGVQCAICSNAVSR